MGKAPPCTWFSPKLGQLKTRVVYGLGLVGPLVLIGVLQVGCATLRPLPPGPVFTADPHALERYQALASRKEQQLKTCAGTGSCAYLHFSRGLVGLFEDRALAKRHFREAASLEAEGRLASSSQLWIELIEQEEQPTVWRHLRAHLGLAGDGSMGGSSSMESLVRDLLERDIVIQQLLDKTKRESTMLDAMKAKLLERGEELEKLSTEQKALEAKDAQSVAPTIERLEHEITVRDRKIKELSSQLDALKRIDQEMREKVRPTRPAPLATPLPHE